MTENLQIKTIEDVNATQPATVNHAALNGKEAQPEVHPLAHLFGKYNDEPLWDEFMAAIAEFRAQRNAEEDVE